MRKKLTRDQDMIILDRWQHDEATQSEMAKEYGVTPSTVSQHIHWAKLELGTMVMQSLNHIPETATIEERNEAYRNAVNTLANQYNIRTDTVESMYHMYGFARGC